MKGKKKKPLLVPILFLASFPPAASRKLGGTYFPFLSPVLRVDSGSSGGGRFSVNGSKASLYGHLEDQWSPLQ